MDYSKEPVGFVKTSDLILWGQFNLKIMKSKDQLEDNEILKLVHWIGMWAIDTLYYDESRPHIGRIGIGIMVTVMLLEFPDHYLKYQLSQYN